MLQRIVVKMVWTGMFYLAAVAAFGQEYPSKTIRIVAAGAGGGTDFDARLIAQGISGPLGQPVVVENRPNLFVHADFLQNSAPDGYNINVTGASFWIAPLLQKTSYDVLRDFVPITQTSRQVFILVVHPSLPVKSVKDLINLAKEKPGQLNYGASNIGGPSHLGSELFKSMAGVKIVHIPYSGGPAALAAVMSGEAQMMINDAGLVAPHVKSGRLKALAVTSAQPSQLAPGLPTVAAEGLPGYETTGMTVMFAPGKTPEAIVTRLSREIARFLNLPSTKEKMLSFGEEPVGSTPEEFTAVVKADIARSSKVIKDTGIKLN